MGFNMGTPKGNVTVATLMGGWAMNPHQQRYLLWGVDLLICGDLRCADTNRKNLIYSQIV